MATINSKYLGQLRTELLHLQSNNKITNDAPTDNNGKGEAFSPTDTVSGALSSCMMTIMGIIATRNGFDLDGMTADVTKVMASDPRRISEIHVNFKWPNAPGDKVTLDKLKRGAKTCPVALSLHPDIKQVITFNF
ncbi:MAG: OsmC family protein [Cyclobacteriaceae bacterium]